MNNISDTQPQIPCLNIAFESAAYQENIYQHYADFHANTPVFTTKGGAVYLTRFADCLHLLKDPGFTRRPESGSSAFSNENRQQNSFESMLNDWMVFQDPPQHTRLREQLNKIFIPARIYAMEGDIRRTVVSLLTLLPSNEPVEFVNRFAYLMPISVICAMLQVEEDNHEQFRLWSRDLTFALNTGADEDIAAGLGAVQALKAYFMSHLAGSANHDKDDILNALLQARDDGELTLEESANICVFMIWTGHETTKHLIANGLLLMLQNPAQMELLRSKPELLDGTIEEVLRYDSPIQKISRWTRSDSLLGGYLVPANSLVTAILGAANRDPEEFERPDAFLIERTHNRHLAFGKGIHHCLGIHLARFEAKIAYKEILGRYRNIALGDYQWRNLSAFRNLEKLELILEK